MLLPPHGIVIQQGDEGGEAASFFYVGKGDCKVNVKDERGKGIFIRRLLEGDHFGEVSIIYNCKRTATVISMNYNTFAFMRSLGYKRLVQDYPEYELCLRRYVTSRYKDHRIQFLKEIVKRIEYFDRVPSEIVYDLIFSLEIKHFDKDENVLQQNDVVDCIYFVEEGTLEVST
jgi:CRP-like cAMP-binding protein